MAYPTELTNQLKAGDNIIKFVPLKYGWVALTEERVIYNARIYYEDTKTKQSEVGNLPISKITSISTRTRKSKSCIGSKKVGVLSINMQGAVYDIIVGKDVSVVRPLIAEFTART